MKEDKKEEINTNVEEKPTKSIANKIINFILILICIGIIAVFVSFMKISITNFNAVKAKKEPTGYKKIVECEKDFKKYKYYEYTLFEIAVIKGSDDVTYSLTPAFFKNECDKK